MIQLQGFLQSIGSLFGNLFQHPDWRNVADVLILTLLIYQVIKLVMHTRSNSLFKGIDLGPVKPKEYAWSRLFDPEQERALRKDSPRMYRKMIVERHKRFVFPLACLVLGIFVIPIATSFQGMKQQSGVLLALLLFLLYYSFLMFGISLGESGDVPPSIGLWLPNALFLLLGIWGMRLSARERMPHLAEYVRTLRKKNDGEAA